jgi:hypothetical protein
MNDEENLVVNITVHSHSLTLDCAQSNMFRTDSGYD